MQFENYLILDYFHHSQRETVYQLKFPITFSPLNQEISVSMNLSILEILCIWIHIVCAICMWLLSLSTLSRFIHFIAGIRTYSFLWPNDIPVYGYMIFHLFINKLMGNLGCFYFGLLQIMLLRTFLYKFLCKHIISPLLVICRDGILVPGGNSIFNCLRKFLVVFHRLFTILQVNQQCIRV